MDLEIKGEAEQGIHDSGFLSIKDSHFLRIVIVSKLYPSSPGVGKVFFCKRSESKSFRAYGFCQDYLILQL